MLAPDGVFIPESRYLIGRLDDLQYDTVYHDICGSTPSAVFPTGSACMHGHAGNATAGAEGALTRRRPALDQAFNGLFTGLADCEFGPERPAS